MSACRGRGYRGDGKRDSSVRHITRSQASHTLTFTAGTDKAIATRKSS